MEIISPRQPHEEITFSLFYERINLPGSGFAFDCDEQGNLIELNPTARESLRGILTGRTFVHAPVIERYVNHYTSPAVGKCICGEEVVLHGFTNTCDRCNRDYNMSGQELGPREQWGEETGESLSDILTFR